MNINEQRIEDAKNLMQCVESFNIAIEQAGGSPMGVERLEKMSLLEFVTQVAARNGIRFVYQPNVTLPCPDKK